MSNKQNKNLMEDSHDDFLSAVMGHKFQDMSVDAPAVPAAPQNTTKEHKPTSKAAVEQHKTPSKKHPEQEYPSHLVTAAEKENRIPAGQWINAKPMSFMDKLKACAKNAGIYAAISMLLFWWQQAELLASEAAIPSFIVLALLAGLQIGRVCHE